MGKTHKSLLEEWTGSRTVRWPALLRLPQGANAPTRASCPESFAWRPISGIRSSRTVMDATGHYVEPLSYTVLGEKSVTAASLLTTGARQPRVFSAAASSIQ
jgi:hypothetical protein